MGEIQSFKTCQEESETHSHSHPYHLDELISILRVLDNIFHFSSHYVVSDLGLQCLPMSQRQDPRHMEFAGKICLISHKP